MDIMFGGASSKRSYCYRTQWLRSRRSVWSWATLTPAHSALLFARSPDRRQASFAETSNEATESDEKHERDFRQPRYRRCRIRAGRSRSGSSATDQPGLLGASWLLGALAGDVLAPPCWLHRQRTQRLLGCLHEHLPKPVGEQCTSAGADST